MTIVFLHVYSFRTLPFEVGPAKFQNVPAPRCALTFCARLGGGRGEGESSMNDVSVSPENLTFDNRRGIPTELSNPVGRWSVFFLAE